jgi:uncharacterized protein (TIGR00251 family)
MSQPLHSPVAFAHGSFVDVSRRGVAVHVRVTAGARTERIEGMMVGADRRMRLRIAVRAAAEGGQANAAAIALLAREWGLPKSSLEIVAGTSSRRKTIGIAGDPAAIAHELASWASRRFHV